MRFADETGVPPCLKPAGCDKLKFSSLGWGMAGETKQAEQSSKVEAVAELVKRLCRALTNVEMFSADHPVSKHGIDLAFQYLRKILDQYQEDVVISVAGNTIVLDGLPLEERNPLVSKLARRFDDVHINNIFFEPAVTAEEFHELYRILGKGPKTVNAEGGFAELLKKSSIRHIHLKDISYVMVTGDEKVVSKDAKVVEGEPVAGVSMDSDIVKYMLGRILEKADEQKWLINEIKNNPGKMAEMITSGIDLAMSRAEMGHNTEGEIGTLINNIRIVGQQLVEQDSGDSKDRGEEDVEKALLTLENELRLRSSKLMSSKVAAGFVNEILGVVTSYSDQVRTKQISDEFLKGEKSLKKTERLLRKMAPEGDRKEKSVVVKVADEIVKRGMSEEDVTKVLDEIKPASQEPDQAKRDDRKPVSDLLSAGIEKRLEVAGLKGDKLKKTMSGLLPYIEAMAKEKAGEFQKEAETLRVEMGQKERMLREMPMGVLTWMPDGKVQLINETARRILRNELGIERSSGLARRLKEWSFPLDDVPDLMKETDLANDDVNLLLNIAKVMKDDDGEPYGVILLEPK